MRNLEKALTEKLGESVTLSPLGGGSTGETFQGYLENSQSKLFIKYDPKSDLTIEARSLQELDGHGEIKTPQIYHSDSHILVMDLIESRNNISQESLGRGLAQIHQIMKKTYGWEVDNWIGLSPQKNTPQVSIDKMSWAEFFWEYRLKYQMELAQKKGKLTEELLEGLKKLETKITSIIPDSHNESTLLHGDLWSGNFIYDSSGNPYLIDPALYYGHREADFGILTMFGGFDQSFFKGYQDEFPLDEDWEYRNPLYKLYHQLNHYNIFGNSYYSAVMGSILYY